MSEPSLDELCQTYNLVSIVNKSTCFKNPKNPSCIDLISFANLRQNGTNKTETHQRQPVFFHE